jgi:hypothetical protein
MRIATIALILALLAPAPAAEPADIVFKNGNIYTVNDRQPRAQAIAVRGQRIIFVGSNRGAEKYIGKNTRVIDLGGHTVVPGLTDSHYHLSGVGMRELELNLEGAASLEEFLARVKARVDQTAPGQWVTGRGWIETFWKPPAFPTRWDLDEISPNNPLFLTRADGHGAVANSLALKIAGIDRNTPSPFGGEIMKDKQTGEPNGILLDRAQELVTRHIPRRTEAELERAIILGAQRSIQMGWCQIQNAGTSYAEMELIKKLCAEGKIKLRIYNAIRGVGPDALRLIRQGPIIGAFDNRFTVRTIKIVLDGALGSKGAALLEPYKDHDTSGLLTYKQEEVMPVLIEALRRGIQIETHAIGDRANRTILDWYEKAFRAVPPNQRKIRNPRWRVEHAQIVHPSDIPRFARLGVLPSMQPSHAISDLHFAPSRLGLERLKGAYAWRSFLKSGSIIAGGSDAPVERGDPMIEFYAAVARKDLKGFSAEGWHPEERVSRQEALKMFTIWAAYAAFEEKLRGSIEVGKLADLTVLSDDIMKIPELEIPKVRCLMTVIGGQIVFDKLTEGDER